MSYRRPLADSKEVRAQLEAYFKECSDAGTKPHSETFRLYAEIENRVKPPIDGLASWNRQQARNRFNNQVLRMLNNMVSDGMLVKRGDRRDLHFYTPEAAAEHDRAESDRAAAAAEQMRRTQEVSRKLTQLGVLPLVRSGAPVSLDLEDWEILVRLAEKGQSRDNG